MYFRFLSGKNSGQLEKYCYYGVFAAGVILSLGSNVYTFFETKKFSTLAVGAVSAALLLLTGRWVKKRKDYSLGQFLMGIIVACVLIPAPFFSFGGSWSGMPVCCILTVFPFSLCQNRKYRYIGFGISLTVIFLLFLLESAFPRLITPLSENSVRADIIFCVFFCAVVLFFLTSILMDTNVRLSAASHKALEGKNRMYQELLERESEKNSSLRRFRHDVHHHNNMLLELLESGNIDRAIEYLREFDSRIPAGTGKMFCVNLALNSILNYMDRLCGKKGIAFSVTADVADHLPVTDDDLSVMVSNLLENAVNGAADCAAQEKQILFRAVTKEDRLTFIFENTCRADVRLRNGMPADSSTGIESVMTAMKAYDGTLEYEKTADDRIRCTLLLNLEYETKAAARPDPV